MFRRAFIATLAGSVVSQVLGADLSQVDCETLRPDPTKTDHMPDIRDSYKKALARGVPLKLTGGDFHWETPSEAGVLLMASNSKIIFSGGARLVWGCEGVYFSPIVAIRVSNIEIINPNFLWTGKMVTGPDFSKFDPSFGSPSVERYGVNYTAYLYCAAILVLECDGIKISGFAGQSVTKDSRSVIHSWIATCRVNGLTVESARFDDCVLGILAQGGKTGLFRDITAGRLNQDIGIPGHVLYTFMREVEIDGVVDWGVETSSARYSSHTVSYGGNGPATIRNIWSRRVCGPLNIKNCINGCEVDGVSWETPLGSEKMKIMTSSLFLVTNTGNAGIKMRNISLKSNGMDCWLLGGDITRADIEAELVRTDDSLPTTGFFFPSGQNGKAKIELIEEGKFVPAVSVGHKAALLDSTLDLTCTGFGSNLLKVETRPALGVYRGNRITIRQNGEHSTRGLLYTDNTESIDRENSVIYQ